MPSIEYQQKHNQEHSEQGWAAVQGRHDCSQVPGKRHSNKREGARGQALGALSFAFGRRQEMNEKVRDGRRPPRAKERRSYFPGCYSGERKI